jgi:DNA-binding MurR/RpiR family transcriptional regulator
MTEILDRLALELPGLSPKLAIAARYALDHPEEIALNSMRSVATSCNIATPTMLRLARHVGFDSYEEFKAQFQRGLVKQSFGSRASALRHTHKAKGDDAIIEQLFDTALENISTTAQNLDLSELQKIAKIMRRAQSNYILGSGSMYWVAALLQSTGCMALPSLRTLTAGNAPYVETLCDISDKDTVLALALSPYTRSTIDAIKMAKSRGATIIAITDKRSSPLLEFASHYILAQATSSHYYPSIISVLAVIEALLALIVANADRDMAKRIKEVELLRRNSEAYQF